MEVPTFVTPETPLTNVQKAEIIALVEDLAVKLRWPLESVTGRVETILNGVAAIGRLHKMRHDAKIQLTMVEGRFNEVERQMCEAAGFTFGSMQEAAPCTGVDSSKATPSP